MALPQLAYLRGTFHCGLIVAIGRLWLSIFCVPLKKATLLSVTQKIKATIDQKSQLGHSEMCHVNRLNMFHVERVFSRMQRFCECGVCCCAQKSLNHICLNVLSTRFKYCFETGNHILFCTLQRPTSKTLSDSYQVIGGKEVASFEKRC